MVTAANQTKVYGAALPTLSGSITGFVNGDDAADVDTGPAYGTPATAASDVGHYAINGSGAADNNYSFQYVAGDLDITKALLMVTAANDSKTYDGVAYSGGNGVGYAGFVNGDDAADLGGTLAYSGTSQGATNAGTYGIGAGGLTSSNYDISYAAGQLDIDRARLVITADNQSKTYGQTFTFDGDEFTTSGLVTGDSVTSVGLSSNGADAPAWAGDYDINLGKVSGNSLSNYDITYVDGTMTVNKANLTITANDQTKPYGSFFEFFGNEFTADGLVSGDLIDLMNLFSEGAPNQAQPGQYVISIGFPYNNQESQRAALAVMPPAALLANYNITLVAGTLTIPTVQPIAPTFRVDPLGRPIVSVANQAIVLDAPFEQIEMLTLNTDVAINYNPGSSSGTSAADLANIAPAAGGEDTSAEGLANIEPAAGGEASGGSAGGSDVACANDFLGNRPCQLPE